MQIEAFAQVVVTLGLSTALTLYFVWKADKREDRMASRIDNLEDFQRNQLVSVCDKTTAALMEDAASSRATTTALLELQTALQDHHKLAQEIDRQLKQRAV